jgi:predicted lipid-binding transport protein (Tim44 family)
VADPSAAQLKGLLERWLKAKATVLAGATPPKDLDQLARQELLRQLEQQRSQDRARGRIQAIEAEVRSVAIQERSPRRIALQADLAYTDLTRDGSGRVIERTPPTSLRNVYVFGRDGETWRLAATRSAR